MQGIPAARLLLRDWLAILSANYHAATHPDEAAQGPAHLAQLPVSALPLLSPQQHDMSAGGHHACCVMIIVWLTTISMTGSLISIAHALELCLPDFSVCSHTATSAQLALS
jgi:hypothetical protein